VSALALLEDGFPHGTRDGYDAGCRGRICSGRDLFGRSCSEAAIAYRGDWTYQKRVDAGMSAAEIHALELAEAEEAKAARRAERKREAEAARAGAVSAAPRLSAVPTGSGKPAKAKGGRKASTREKPWTAAEKARVALLNASGWNDSRIARELGRPVSSTRAIRIGLGLERIAASGGVHVPITHGTPSGYARGCKGSECPATPSCGDVGRAYYRERWAKRRDS